MNLFKIYVQLYEDGKPLSDLKRPFFTIANSLAGASNYVLREVVEVDEPEEGFTWHVVDACLMDGDLCLPAITHKIIPRLE
jgi:hypothetical protein